MTTIDIPAWVGVIGGLFVAITMLTGAIALVRSTMVKTQTAVLLSTNEGLQQRVTFLEEEGKRKDAAALEKDHRHELEQAAVKAQNEELMKRVEVLQTVVTGKKELQNIMDFLVVHDNRVDGFMLGQERHDQDAADRNKVIRDLLAANKSHIQSVDDKVTKIAESMGVEVK